MGNTGGKFKQVEYCCPNCRVVCKPYKKMITQQDINKFLDEHGNQHVHDPNTGTVFIKCKRGHISEHAYGYRCLTCGWLPKADA